MAVVYRLEISESEEELKEILGRQKIASDRQFKDEMQLMPCLKSWD
jgi:hypothetical protein